MPDATKPPKPPSTYRNFVARFPELGEAWENARAAEKAGPLDHKTRRLMKLAVAIGAMREGAVHSATRKAKAAGATEDELYQTVALAASTLGFPSTVAVYSWVTDTLTED
jgi:alkylhydroperoxidase/carboxymuconolactone decarboxylase family protein YurZ